MTDVIAVQASTLPSPLFLRDVFFLGLIDPRSRTPWHGEPWLATTGVLAKEGPETPLRDEPFRNDVRIKAAKNSRKTEARTYFGLFEIRGALNPCVNPTGEEPLVISAGSLTRVFTAVASHCGARGLPRYAKNLSVFTPRLDGRTDTA